MALSVFSEAELKRLKMDEVFSKSPEDDGGNVNGDAKTGGDDVESKGNKKGGDAILIDDDEVIVLSDSE